MNIKKHIPNFITSLGLSSGLVAIYFVMTNDMRAALMMLLLASLFDFLDGAFARLLNVMSPMGKELDSMSDMVVFGLVPGLALHTFAVSELGLSYPLHFTGLSVIEAVALFAPALIVIFSALRLAKFNIDDSQTYYFKGLATPGNALMILSLIHAHTLMGISDHQIPLIVILLSVISAALLVGPLKLFSLKFKDLSFTGNWFRYLFLVGSLILLIVLGLFSISLIIIFYLMLSILLNVMGHFKQTAS